MASKIRFSHTAIGILATVIAGKAVAFNVFDHVTVTRNALSQYPPYVLANGNTIRFDDVDDVAGANIQTDLDQTAYRHCDDEQVQQCRARVVHYRDLIVGLLSADPFANSAAARVALGAALHTIQDFYAHTSWIERNDEPAGPTLESGIVSPPPTCSDGSRLVSPLVPFTSGYYFDGDGPDALRTLRDYVALGRCLHGQTVSLQNAADPRFPTTVEFAGIAKDSGPNRAKAGALATQATIRFVQHIETSVPAAMRDKAMCALLDSSAAACMAPTVTLFGEPISLPVGQIATLTWTSTNAISCTALGGSGGADWSGVKALSGSSAVTSQNPGTYTYRLMCDTAVAEVSIEFVDESCEPSTEECLPPPVPDECQLRQCLLTIQFAWHGSGVGSDSSSSANGAMVFGVRSASGLLGLADLRSFELENLYRASSACRPSSPDPRDDCDGNFVYAGRADLSGVTYDLNTGRFAFVTVAKGSTDNRRFFAQLIRASMDGTAYNATANFSTVPQTRGPIAIQSLQLTVVP